MSNTATVIKDGMVYHKITKELYIKHKKDGWTDRRIMQRYGMHNASMSAWKKANLTEKEMADLSLKKQTGIQNLGKYLAKKEESVKEKPKLRQAVVKTFEKELKQALDELQDLKKENEDLAARLALLNVEDNSELNNLKSACSDLENENSNLQRKLIEQDYKIENRNHALKSLHEKTERLEKENKAFKELVKLWI